MPFRKSMENTLCTISSESHLYKVLALYDSLRAFMPELKISVLLVDGDAIDLDQRWKAEGIEWYGLAEVSAKGLGKKIREKYSGKKDRDRMRWCLKPIFIQHLLESGFEKVIYVDNDIYFFDSPGFLFEMLDQHKVLLSPHWRTIHPEKQEGEFSEHFTDGLFNGGFIAANREGIPAMEWWAEACLYKCIKDRERGFWDDQRYLDLLHHRFEGVYAIRHKGCNIAAWNRTDLERVKVGEEVLINGKWPIVFIHFTQDLFTEILIYKNDVELESFVLHYFEVLKKYNPNFNFKIPGPPAVRRKLRLKTPMRVLKYKWVIQYYLRKSAKFLRLRQGKR